MAISVMSAGVRNPPSEADYVLKTQPPQEVVRFVCPAPVRTIVFVCDGSASIHGTAATVKDELNRAVLALRPIDWFDVIFYRDGNADAFKTDMVAAAPVTKRHCAVWMDGVRMEGKSDPVAALDTAMKLKPNRIYFITGPVGFPNAREIKTAINRGNKDRKIKISTILFVANAAERAKNESLELLLKDVAANNGGKFRLADVASIRDSVKSGHEPATQPASPSGSASSR